MTRVTDAQVRALTLVANGSVFWETPMARFWAMREGTQPSPSTMKALEQQEYILVDRSAGNRWSRLVHVTDKGWDALGINPAAKRVLPVGADVIYTNGRVEDLDLFRGQFGRVEADHTIVLNGEPLHRWEPFDLALAPGQHVTDRDGVEWVTLTPRGPQQLTHQTWLADFNGDEIRTIATRDLTLTRNTA